MNTNIANNVTIIPAKKFIGTQKEDATKNIRVAAYCRVSTDNEEQESSYEMQVEHYEKYIKGHPGWEYVGIYADDGISGTNIKKRDAFNKMIKDCEDGKIDMIITKSISRFARNTLDCLNYTRKLKQNNIAIFFEKENINSLDSKGEVLLTIMASLAQQESESISANVKLGLQFRYQSGKLSINHNWFLGYTKDEDGNLIIDPEEAEVVKRIYREYLNGKSPKKIKNELEADGILNGAKHKRWHESNIVQILTNEKYIGDALLQKTYTVDFLEKKRNKNNGQLPKYYVENSHEAIIPKEVFYRVKEEMLKRKKIAKGEGIRRRYIGKYALSGIVICGKCGDAFRRKQNSKKGKDTVWTCVKKVEKSDEKCSSKSVKEEVIQWAILEAINEVFSEKCNIMSYLEDEVMKFIDEEQPERTSIIDKKIRALQNELIAGRINANEIDRIGNEINLLRKERERISINDAVREKGHEKAKEIYEFFQNTDKKITEYDDSLVRRFVEQIIVNDDYLAIEFKNGMQVYVEK